MQVAGLPLTSFLKLRSSSARFSSSENKTNSLNLSVILFMAAFPYFLCLLGFERDPFYRSETH